MRHLRDTIDRPEAGERFEVRDLIGQGGMGRVYAVHDHVLGREVAMKVLSLDADTPTLAARLQREARVLARLEHPAIAAIHDAGVLPDGRPYYLMRLVRGTSLAEGAHTITRGERLRVFLRVCDAIAFAHAQGIVHRDVKPGNIMIGAFGDVVVLDWGVAKVLHPRDEERDADIPSDLTHEERGHDDATRDGMVVGTPGFMAPEQATGLSATVDARADVFGLGALLRALLSEVPSPKAASVATQPEAPLPPSIPAPLSAIVACATAHDPSNRYQRVDLLAADVRRWLDAEPVSVYRENLLERSARFYGRNRTLLLLLLAYAVVRVTILVWRGV